MTAPNGKTSQICNNQQVRILKSQEIEAAVSTRGCKPYYDFCLFDHRTKLLVLFVFCLQGREEWKIILGFS